MRRFEIYDSTKRGHVSCATLFVDDEDRASIVINEEATTADVPMLFVPFIENGVRVIPDMWAQRWIDERVVPSNRQNIGEVLRANGLVEYDRIELLARGSGRSSQDDFLVREKMPDKYSGTIEDEIELVQVKDITDARSNVEHWATGDTLANEALSIFETRKNDIRTVLRNDMAPWRE